MKSLTVAYHDEGADSFGRVQVIAESAFPEYASRGFVEVEVGADGKVTKADRDTEPEADAAAQQALQAKAAADAANASEGDDQAPKAATSSTASSSSGGSSPSSSGSGSSGGGA